jgi:hypothetical protein
MKYLMFVATDTEPDTDPNAAPDIEAWFEDVNGRGKWVMGDRLRPREDATTVRVRSGELLVTDGPFTVQGVGGRIRRARMRGPGRGYRDRLQAPDRPPRPSRGPAVLADRRGLSSQRRHSPSLRSPRRHSPSLRSPRRRRSRPRESDG